MIRRPFLLAVLLLLAGGLVVALVLRVRGGGESDGPGRDAGRPPPVAAAPVLGGTGRPPAGSSPGSEGGAKDGVAALPADLPPWGLSLRVVTGDRHDMDQPVPRAAVHVTLVGPEGEAVLYDWSGTADAQGVCRLGPLTLPRIPRRWGGEAVLEVRAEAPHPSSSWPPRYSLEELAARVRRTPDQAGVRWLEGKLKLWTVRRVRGRLLTSSGHPVDGAWVGVVPRTPGFGASQTGWDGAFQVEVPVGGGPPPQIEAEVVGAFEIHHLEVVEAFDGDEVFDVRLSGDGDARGRVTDAAGNALAGVHLVLARSWWDPNAGLKLIAGGYTPPRSISRLKTRSAEDGSFAFAGLIEGEAYVLWWPGDDDQWQRLPDDVLRGEDDLNVVLERHRFRPVLVDAGNGRRVHGQVRLRRIGSGDEPVYRSLRAYGSTPEEDGTIAAPGERFRIHAWARGYEASIEDFTMPEDPGTHEVPVALRPLAPGPVVRVRFVDGAGEALGRVPVVLTREVPGFWGDLDLRIALEEEREGWIRLRDLPPGPVHLETKEKLGHPPSGPWRFTLPLEDDWSVPESGAMDRKIACPQGGSVRLFLRLPPDVESRDMGELSLHHESGIEDSPWWYALEDDGEWDFEIIGDGKFEPDGRTYESSALPPGAWTLEIEENEAWRTVSIPLRLSPGEITELRVTLEMKD